MSDKADSWAKLKGVDLKLVEVVCEDFFVEVSKRGYAIPRSKRAPIRRRGVALFDNGDYILNVQTESGFDAVIKVIAHWVEHSLEPEVYLALESPDDPGSLADRLAALTGQKVRLLFRKQAR